MKKDESLVDELRDEIEETVGTHWPPRPRRLKRIALGVTAVVALALFATWTQREPIARNIVEDALEKRGVQASYDIERIGFRTQRIENLVIGDPRNPDLTAEWAEVVTRYGFTGPGVAEIRAHGVRLRGRLVDGSFSFGAVDRLLPEPTGEPFALPDIRVVLSDAQVRLDLPNGPIGARLEGRGNLSDGFRGNLAANAPQLAIGDCALSGMTASLDLAIDDKRPRVSGPVRATALACAGQGLAIDRPQAVVDARFNEALNHWQGSAGVDVPVARMGDMRLGGVIGTVDFDGRSAATRGDIKVAAQDIAAAGISGRGVSLKGGYEIGGKPDGVAATFGGRAEIERAALDRQSLAQVASLGASAEGTPAAPIVRALANAITRAGRDTALSADFSVAHRGSSGSLRIASLAAISRSGARISLSDGQGVRFGWPGTGAALVDGRLTVGGGGFPGAVVQLSQREPGAPITGSAVVAPYAVDGARLALTPVRFTADRDGATRFETRVTLDGPLGDGRVTGLTLPIDGRLGRGGAMQLNPGCTPLSFASLNAAGLALGANRMTLCPNEGPALFAMNAAGRMSGGVRLAPTRLSGQLGDSPVSIALSGAEVGLARQGFSARDVALRLGAGESVTRLDIARLAGGFRDGAVAGTFEGTGGQIANVRLLVSEGAGKWSIRDGALALDGRLRVADAEAQPRFNPLVSEDFTLLLKGDRLTAKGQLRDPASKTGVADVDIVHNMGAATGEAVLDVAGLAFGEGFQPDTLTPAALGVVANVRATVTGRGNIRWTPQGVRSDGVFRTQNADLAAAFGPVTAATGELRFTDLLGLVSGPGQRLYLGEVNPGIAVLNGYVDYQLLPGQKVQIEGGRWPFAGGELILDPTVLDFGVEKERRLTFRVVGLDAAQFINQFELKDINVTGVFDGTIPMVFDDTGGRIEGGRLVVREEGGTLAYVGQVSNEDLGMFGSMAFDALKSIKYSRLAIDLNGPLDAEMVTQVRFTGTNQGTVDVAASSLTAQFIGLPFIFNITIRAPFRGLLNTARSFTDPSLLIRQNLPGFEAAEEPAKSVQPEESEKMQ
ncbi:YdbH domain-containing protein [Sphingomonas sp. LaA6.9]|uniref:YdbH domain-containing protein n=1 Tax=Sphingomonas sp. LaA6.9 TaxID=2919914 RepID=UPI001F4FC117|nr:YdbH domain-containing protein [Sphingomonas sp. LaA6.9]MCJ8159863.1 YdbH domain-containing protein [Sphingomonas sp. LaA6.9]